MVCAPAAHKFLWVFHWPFQCLPKQQTVKIRCGNQVSYSRKWNGLVWAWSAFSQLPHLPYLQVMWHFKCNKDTAFGPAKPCSPQFPLILMVRTLWFAQPSRCLQELWSCEVLPVPCVGTVTILGCVCHCCTLLLSVSHPKPDPIEPGEKHGSALFVILWDTRRVCVNVSIYYCLFIIAKAPKSRTWIWLFFRRCNWNF